MIQHNAINGKSISSSEYFKLFTAGSFMLLIFIMVQGNRNQEVIKILYGKKDLIYKFKGKISYIYREQNHPKLTSIPDDIPDEVYNVHFQHNNLGKIPSNSLAT